MMRQNLIELLNYYNEPIPLYLDCTGQVVRNPRCCEHNYKRIFYNAGVVQSNKIIIPVIEMITCMHDIKRFKIFVGFFKRN